MSVRRPDRPADSAAADRLLDGAGGTATDPLASLLAAAAAPARPHELAGEEAAMAAFRAARAAPTPSPARAPRRRRFTAGAVAWTGGVLATATAGAAFAAVTLERPEEPAPPPAPTTPAPATGSPDGSPTGAGPSTGGPGGSPTAVPTPGGAGPSATPGQGMSLAGHCRAYLAMEPDQREKALRTPGYRPLVDAAGGAGKVEGYCRQLLGDDAEPGGGDDSGNGRRPGAGTEPDAPGTASPEVRSSADEKTPKDKTAKERTPTGGSSTPKEAAPAPATGSPLAG